MDAVDDVQVRDWSSDDVYGKLEPSPVGGESKAFCSSSAGQQKQVSSNAAQHKVKKMTSTTRKMLKFGYTQVLRASDSLTKGKVPGEKMAFIIANDEAADAILDEILTELDQKYKVEQYLGPESKLALFTAQLLLQARGEESKASRSSSSSSNEVSS